MKRCSPSSPCLFFANLIILLLTSLFCLGQDDKDSAESDRVTVPKVWIVNGEAYEIRKVIKVNEHSVVMQHKGGVDEFQFTDLPPRVQKAFGYEATQATDSASQDADRWGPATAAPQNEETDERWITASTVEDDAPDYTTTSNADTSSFAQSNPYSSNTTTREGFPMPENMGPKQFLGIGIAVLALMGSFVCSLWFLIVAFKTHVLWGLGVLMVPFVGLIFLIMHWDEAGKPFLYNLAATFVAIMGILMVMPSY